METFADCQGQSFADLLTQFPKEGWIHLVRSVTNDYKWWCRYEAPVHELESWADTPEDAMKNVLQKMKDQGVV